MVLVGSVSQGLAAAVIHVGPGDDYTQIQAAIDAAQNGDTVLVAPGLYIESISYRGKAITVASEAGATATTIQGAGSSTVLFATHEGADAVLEGFTVTGGSGTSSGGPSLGGGILCDGSSPSVRDCVVQGNSADAGGGLFLNLSQASLAGVTISANTSNGYGGGIYSQSSQPTLRDCALTQNESPWSGAGIYAQDSVITLIDTTISKHECPGHGSACDAHASSIDLAGCTIEDNVAGKEGTVRIVGGSLAASACSFRRNLAAQSSGGIFADVTELSVTGCTFENNTVNGDGAYSAAGALYLTARSDTELSSISCCM
jgi:predicted outer membrane repeat protein